MSDFVHSLMDLFKSGKIDKQDLLRLLTQYKSVSGSVAEKDIAIVGIACRMPQADTTDQFWNNLAGGVNSVRAVPDSRLTDVTPLMPYFEERLKDKHHPYWVAGFLDDIAHFDNDHFGILPAEAEIMDPHQRMFLEIAYEAFENAGLTRQKLAGTNTGVFVGDVMNEYRQVVNKASSSAVIGNVTPFIASRVSHYYNLRGPAINVSTTCSTSLVAVHMACQSLITKECDVALTGAVNHRLFPFDIIDDPVDALGISTENGACRAFSDSADGVVRGEGGAALILKRYKDAVRDNDRIYVVIRGSGVNNDGKSSSVGAPNPIAQAALLEQTWKKSGIDVSKIGYIEAHGTGTHIGDPIEVQGLVQAFSKFTQAKQFCGLGSVKTNIGHLTGGASGLAGLLKAILCIQNKMLVPSLHFDKPNRMIDFPETPFYVCSERQTWPGKREELIAGVSAFGFNGTNCHIVLQGVEERALHTITESLPFLFSHRTSSGLVRYLKQFLAFLEKESSLDLLDISYTLLHRRDKYEHSVHVSANSVAELTERLQQLIASKQLDNSNLDSLKGFSLDYYSAKNARVATLPAYTFERKKFWIRSEKPIFRAERLQYVQNASTEEGISNDIENTLLEIFKDIMGLESITSADSFFELGGDSLLGVDIVNQVHKKLGIKISYNDLFSLPIIDDLAKKLKSAKGNEFKEIVPVPKADKYPVSHGQKRIYVLHNMQDNPIAYNIYDAFTIRQDVDVNAFMKSTLALAKKHQVFSTSYVIEDEELYQKINDSADIEFEFLDLSQRTQEQEDVIASTYQRPFELDKGALARIRLIKTAEDEFKLVFVVHHIISDGHSINLFVKELVNTYLELKDRKTLMHKENRIDYVDFCNWQSEAFESESFIRDQKFWLERCKSLPICHIQGDLPRPKVFNFQGKRLGFQLDSQLFSELGRLAGELECTIFMILVAAIDILIYRFSQQTDIVIGSPVIGRSHADLKSMIGFFVNTIVIRNQLNPESSVIDLIKQVKETVSQALEHQDYPFDLLVSQLDLKRDTSRSPVFNINLAFQNFELDIDTGKELANLQLERHSIPHHSCKWDLEFEFVKNFDKSVTCYIEYYSAVYSDAMVANLQSVLIETLSQIVACASIPISNMKSSVNSAFLHGNEIDPGMNAFTVSSLFEKQVSETPNAIAVIDSVQKISYSELNKEANQIAHYLIHTIGLEKGERICIYLGNSYQSVAAIIGAIKAGLVYVPIDVKTPLHRCKQIVLEGDLKYIISEKKYAKRLDEVIWSLPQVKGYLLVDSDDFEKDSLQSESELMDEELWNQVSNESTDTIKASGWVSSYTGKSFSAEEMQEYSDNISSKVGPYIDKTTRVLEIGCGSGFSTFALATYSGRYLAIDLSSEIVAKNASRARKEGYSNLEFKALSAHDIEKIDEHFDVVIINSVIHCFPSLTYFEQILKFASEKLIDGGVVFLGDLMKLESKDSMIKSLQDFKNQNTEKELRTKLNWDHELFISETYLQGIAESTNAISKIETSSKLGKLSNELTDFRFDALVHVTKCKEIGIQSTKTIHSRKHYKECSIDNPDIGLLASDPIYVIFTSGSTGTPKGVEVCHNSLVNYLLWAMSEYKKERLDFVYFTSLAFDLTVTSLFTPLLTGSTLYAIHGEFHDVIDTLFNIEADLTIKLTPSHLSILLDQPQLPKSLNQYILGGETLHHSLVKALFSKAKRPIRIHNEYGPTEATVGCIHHECKNGAFEFGTALIGVPIAGVFAACIDRYGMLVPVGAVGEIVVGGHCLSRGYLYNRELTAQKFQNANWINSLFYKTGDIGRVLPNGSMESFGRLDRQVKIHGHRIELDDIEHWMRRMAGVSKAAVTLRENQQGNQVLFGYYSSQSPIATDDMHNYLTSQLAPYMVPYALVNIKEMPLARSGKINYSALPAIDLNSSSEVIAPRNEYERVLHQIWSLVLDIPLEQLSVEDNFFDLGGDSIIAMRILPRLKHLGITLALTDLFEFGTIAAISKLPKFTSYLPENNQVIAVDQKRVSGTAPLTPIQLWIEEMKLEHPEFFNMVYMFKVPDDIDKVKLEKAILECVKHRSSLRLVYAIDKGVITQKYALYDSLFFELEEINSDEFNSEEQKELVLRESQRIQSSFDLDRAPLIKGAIFDLKGCGKHLFIAIHHLIIDGVSWRYFIEDIVQAYQGKNCFRDRPEVTNYQDWARSLSKHPIIDDTQLSYWLNIDTDSYKRLSDLPREKWLNQDYDESVLIIDSKRTIELIRKCKELNSNVNNVLLAVLSEVCASLFNENSTLIHHEGHGRDYNNGLNVMDTYGWFTTIFPLLLTNLDSRAATLECVNKSLEEIKGLEVPFGVAKYIQKHSYLRSLNPEILFNYFGRVDRALADNGVLTANFEQDLGSTTHPRNRVPHLLELNAIVIEDKLRVSITFNAKVFSRDFMRNFIEHFDSGVSAYQLLETSMISPEF